MLDISSSIDRWDAVTRVGDSRRPGDQEERVPSVLIQPEVNQLFEAASSFRRELDNCLEALRLSMRGDDTPSSSHIAGPVTVSTKLSTPATGATTTTTKAATPPVTSPAPSVPSLREQVSPPQATPAQILSYLAQQVKSPIPSARAYALVQLRTYLQRKAGGASPWLCAMEQSVRQCW